MCECIKSRGFFITQDYSFSNSFNTKKKNNFYNRKVLVKEESACILSVLFLNFFLAIFFCWLRICDFSSHINTIFRSSNNPITILIKRYFVKTIYGFVLQLQTVEGQI